MYITEKKLEKLQYIGFLILFISLFILTHSIRKELLGFTQRSYFYAINYLAYLGLFLMMITQSSSQIKQNIFYYILPLIACLFPIYTTILLKQSFGFLLVYLCCCVFSIYTLFIEFTPTCRTQKITLFLKIFNILIIILALWAVIDHVFGQPILKFLATFWTTDRGFQDFAYPKTLDQNRFLSFIGHPLTNALLFNAFFAFNICYNRHHKEIMPSWVCCIINLVSIACCGSKTGLFVAIGLTILCFYNNLKLLIVSGIVLMCVLLSGLMNNLIERLLTIPLTTGRAKHLAQLLADPAYSFHLFKGYGNGTSISKYSAAFEFSAIGFSFDYGILFALLMLGLPLVYVTHKLWRRKDIHTWVMWGLLFAEINTYASLGVGVDLSMIFYFLSMFLLNISYDTN